jgi:MOSC domain-containing protein YiiM
MLAAEAHVAGPIWLARTNLAGDGQADLENHGGVEQAVLAYAGDHYPAWRTELALPDMPYGAFGENFTIAGQDETTVCIGDTYAIGEAIVQVSQPRGPCWKLARRWRIKDLTARVQRSGRAGWYLRVLREGHVAAGQPVRLLERPFPQWTIARVNALLNGRDDDRRAIAELAACPLLGPNWRAALLNRAAS